MKKVLLSVALVLGMSDFASGRSNIFKSDDNRGFFGVRVALDMTGPEQFKLGGITTDLLSAAPGVSFGAVYQLPVVANLYLEPGLSFYYDTWLLNIDILGSEGLPLAVKYNNRSLRSFGMRVPVVAGYHLDFVKALKVFAFTGPVLDVGFSNDYYINFTDNGVHEHIVGTTYSDDSMIPLKRLDVAWRVGLGASIGHLSVDLCGDIGMLNRHRDPYNANCRFFSNTFHLTLGYNF